MIGDIHRPQRRTWIMFSASWTSPSRVNSVADRRRVLPEVGRHERPVDREQPGGDRPLITPASASANSRLTPAGDVPRLMRPHLLSSG